mgnify:CR=1 FL=1
MPGSRAVASGSSPLTRGKLCGLSHSPVKRGLIPAHAGKTSLRNTSRAMYRAHPRSRGENRGVHFRSLTEGGSSPLTRGKPKFLNRRATALGLIPAHAGKTGFLLAQVGAFGAHPRSRGENPGDPLNNFGQRGSSPLTRGKRVLEDWGRPAKRLIPAHAGKTAHGARVHSNDGAHPRSRGENRSGVRRRRPRGGSSPLTRGKP